MVCRSSPFFWAFQQGLVQDIDVSATIFAFTDAIPGAEVGAATQHIDQVTGTLVSSVRLTVFPNIAGDVVTRSTITGVHLPPPWDILRSAHLLNLRVDHCISH